MANNYKSLKITIEAHSLLKEYCDKNFIKMNDWVSFVLINHIKGGKNENLWSNLQNNKSDKR